MIELANAHDSDDCLEGCQHPDHDFDGEVIDLDFFLQDAERERFQGCWGMGAYPMLEFVSL